METSRRRSFAARPSAHLLALGLAIVPPCIVRAAGVSRHDLPGADRESRIGIDGGLRSIDDGPSDALAEDRDSAGSVPTSRPAPESSAWARVPAMAAGLESAAEIFERERSGNHRAAMHALARLIRRGGQELAAAEQAAQARFRAPLASVMAEWRLRDALERPGPLRLRGVTRYEAYALGTRAALKETEWLGAVHADRTIETWARDPAAYQRLHDRAQTMVEQARCAAALIGERLRFDPALDGDVRGRENLAALRDALMRFSAHVAAMPGFTSLPPPEAIRGNRRAAAVQAPTSRPFTPHRHGSLFDDD